MGWRRFWNRRSWLALVALMTRDAPAQVAALLRPALRAAARLVHFEVGVSHGQPYFITGPPGMIAAADEAVVAFVEAIGIEPSRVTLGRAACLHSGIAAAAAAAGCPVRLTPLGYVRLGGDGTEEDVDAADADARATAGVRSVVRLGVRGSA